MSKRFISTEIWRKQWFRELSPAMKTFWIYAFTNCDNAGVFELDIGLAEFQIGCKLDIELMLSDFNGQIEKLSGNKFFICDFVRFQYGELSEDCKPHKPIIALLEKYGLRERVSKGFPKGINTLEEKEKEKEQEKEKDKEKEKDLFSLKSPEKLSFKKPTVDEVEAYCLERKNGINANKFVDYYEARGWMIGKNKMKSWQAAVRTWEGNDVPSHGKLGANQAQLRQSAGRSNQQRPGYDEHGRAIGAAAKPGEFDEGFITLEGVPDHR